MGDDDTFVESKALMSLNSMLMFIGQRTYPEIRPAVIKLSTKYNKQLNWIYARQPEWHNMFMVVRKLIN